MKKYVLLLCLLTEVFIAYGQAAPVKVSRWKPGVDSLPPPVSAVDQFTEELPEIQMHENERSESLQPYIAPLLTANRDVLYTAAAFQFSALRFRIRGYDASFSPAYINGLCMNAPDNGNTPWALWGGLNDAMRNSVLSLHLRNNEFSFGSLGNTLSIDARASKQRKQTQFGYAVSNRSYTHRWTFTHATGLNKKGWAFAFSGSRRYAQEGFIPGTFYDGWSYFMAADKKVNEKQLLSLVLFGAPLSTGNQGPIPEQLVQMLGRNYNPYWGYQSGKKRNANTTKSHQPVLILTHNLRLNNHTTVMSAAGMVTGERSRTGLDWYKAADPRPDYYRYMPAFQTDSFMRISVAEAIERDVNLQQVNWQKMYDINKASKETVYHANGIPGHTVTGARSHYILEDRVSNLRRMHMGTTFHSRINHELSVTAGISFAAQRSHYFKRVNDLLGGDFYLNRNQFAERDFPADSNAVQYDLDHPNRILREGDAFGYDYTTHTSHLSGWLQVAITKRTVDFFASMQFSGTRFKREGHVRNGLFPSQSKGVSVIDRFRNHAVKAGITYKLNGRNYLYAHTAVLTKAPFFDQVFVSPGTRDTRQDQVNNETIQAIEAGYVLNAPVIKLRLSGYVTRFDNGMKVLTFYHDEYRNFVNYALNNIDKLHSGMEAGLEAGINERWMFQMALALGTYYYSSRQQVTVSLDNNALVLDKHLVYTRHFKIPGTPQMALSAGVRYQRPGAFFFNATANYSRNQWLEFNPLRRTYVALQDVIEHSNQWNSIIRQQQLPAAITVNVFAGTGIRLKTPVRGIYRILTLYIGINNLLNNRNMVSGGYEQLRFDMDQKDVNKFPPKFFYAYGLNFSAGTTFRL